MGFRDYESGDLAGAAYLARTEDPVGPEERPGAEELAELEEMMRGPAPRPGAHDADPWRRA